MAHVRVGIGGCFGFDGLCSSAGGLQSVEDGAELFPVFLVGDESDAIVAPAKAGVLGPVLEVEAVVVGEFFSFGDFSERVNPYFAADDVGLTVGITGVIDQPCGIPCHGAVDVGAFIQFENIDRGAACLF